VAVNAYSASQAGKGGSPSPETERIANAKEKRSQEIYDRYKQVYEPREDQLVNQVFDQSRTPAAEAARSGAEARASIDNSEQIGLRNARRAGIKPSSPAFESISRRQQATDAGLEAAARTGGRRYANETNTSQQIAALNMGKGLPQESDSLDSSAANLYGYNNELSMVRSNAAGQLYGRAAAQLGDLVSRRRTPTQTSSGITDRYVNPDVYTGANNSDLYDNSLRLGGMNG
jgi:hypothetical protein